MLEKMMQVFGDILDQNNIIVYVTKHAGSSSASYTGDGSLPSIAWDTAEDGSALANLAHEIGHHVLGHTKHSYDPFRQTQQDYEFECQAWDYSEKLCKERGIPFDHKYKKICLDHHRKYVVE